MANRFAAGCRCCGCVYEASDGSTYATDFSEAMDFDTFPESAGGWTPGFSSIEAQTAGGVLEIRRSASEWSMGRSYDYLYRAHDFTTSTEKLIVECDVKGAHSDVTHMGIGFGGESAGASHTFLIAYYSSGAYGVRFRDAAISNAAGTPPADTWEKLSLRVERRANGRWNWCAFVDEELIASTENSGAAPITTSGHDRIGMLVGCSHVAPAAYRPCADNFTVAVD